MVTVSLSPYTKRQIMHQTEQVVRKNAGPKKTYPATAPTGVGDDVFGLLLPSNIEKQILDMSPNYLHNTGKIVYVGLAGATHVDDYFHTPVRVMAECDHQHIVPVHGTEIRNAPGIEVATYYGGVMTITLATDGSVIEAENLRKFVDDMKAIGDYNAGIDTDVKKALSDMGTFLSQHRTLQSAVKAFGPALMEFIPKDIQEQMDRPSKPIEPKAKRVKPEKVEVDLGSLVAHATTHKLRL